MTYNSLMRHLKKMGWKVTTIDRVKGGLRVNAVTKKGKPRTYKVDRDSL